MGGLTAAAPVVWAAYLYGREVSRPDVVVADGLAANGLVVVGIGLTLAIIMLSASAVMLRCWTGGHRMASSLIGITWLGTCAAGAATLVLNNPLDIPVLRPKTSFHPWFAAVG